MINFKPLHDRIAVVPVAQEEKTLGGIIIPDTAKEKPVKGKVVAVGSGTRDKDNNLIPLEVKIDGQDVVIMKESDVMGIITK